MALEAFSTSVLSKSMKLREGPPQHSPSLDNFVSVTNDGHFPSGIETLLADSDGVELFRDFLATTYSSGHLLDFWFACKGFRLNVDPTNPDKLFQVAKVIYRTYVKSDSAYTIPLSPTIKRDLVDRMSSYHRGYKKCKSSVSTRIDRTLFDRAQDATKCILERRFYPEFLDCIRNLYVEPRYPVVSSSNHLAVSPSLKNNLLPIDIARLGDPQHTSTSSSDRFVLQSDQPVVTSVPPASRVSTHPPSGPQAPSSQQHGPPRTCPVTQPTFRPIQIDSTQADSLGVTIKPGENLAETDPSSFVIVLTSRLEKVRESRLKMEKLLSWVHQVDDKPTIPDFQEEEVEEDDNFDSTKPDPSSLLDSRSSSMGPASGRHVFSPPAPSSMKHHPSDRKALPRGGSLIDDNDAQGILDDHCSRIWSDDREQRLRVTHRRYHYHHHRGPETSVAHRLMIQSCIPDAGAHHPTGKQSYIVSSYQQPDNTIKPFENHSQRRRPTSRSVMHRSAYRSDAQSTTSWDSGVVDPCIPGPDHTPHGVQMELETKSIVAAASLQALSSSTTELAVANSEATAKLVEHMTRHYFQNQRRDSLTSGLEQRADFEGRPIQRNNYPFFQPPDPTSQYFHASYPPVPPTYSTHLPHTHRNPSSVSPSNACCLGSHASAGDCHATHLSTAGSDRVSHAFPIPSDTSSTFDSGISSTYDQLPSSSGALSIDRTTRSQSLRSWQVKRRQLIASNPPRAPSSSSSCCRAPPSADPNGHPTLSSPIPTTSWPADLGAASSHHPSTATGSVTPCCPIVARTCESYSNATEQLISKSGDDCELAPSGSGRLLQHWLQSQNIASKSITKDPSNNVSVSSRKIQHRRQGPSHRHGRKYSSYEVSPAFPAVSVIEGEDSFVAYHDQLPKFSISSSGASDQSSITGQSGLIVGYYLCDDPVPYRTVWTGSNGQMTSSLTDSLIGSDLSLTLGQFKQLIAKRGSYRYFFKKPSDEFGTGVVHEELTNDNALVPLWEGKVVARIERAE